MLLTAHRSSPKGNKCSNELSAILQTKNTALAPSSLTFRALYPVFRTWLYILSITPSAKIILIFLLLPWTRWPSNSRHIIELLFPTSWIFWSPFLSYFQEWIFKWGTRHYPSSSSRSVSPDGCFCFRQGKDFRWRNSCFFCFLYTALRWRNILEDNWRRTALCSFLLENTGICNSLPASSGRSFYKFPWGPLMTSDGRKSS